VGEDPVRAARRRYAGILASATGFELATTEALITEAAGIEQIDPILAGAMYAEASTFAACTDVALAQALALRSAELAPGDPRTTLALAVAANAAGDATRAGELIGAGLERLELDDAESTASYLHQLAAVFYYLEHYEHARLLLDRAAELARASRALRVLPLVLDTIAALESRTGRYTSAQAKSLEALRIARDTGQLTQAASCLTTLALIDAIRGHERECVARAREAVSLVDADHVVHAWAAAALALLDLGRGRADAVVAASGAMDDALAATGWSADVETLWLPILVEAHNRLGARKAAAAIVDRLVVVDSKLSTVHAHAVTARCRALVAGGTDAIEWFERALEWHGRSPRIFDRARTELCYGEWLRRARKPHAARVQLESALATFERLRATPWSEQARRELGAGRRSSRRDAVAELTGHERRVAALVTQGATNKEAAAALFVTPKTVEHHLTSIYAKLGVRSRSELTRALLTAPD
jgi:DNA-binding CsgD family transcriptional regulator